MYRKALSCTWEIVPKRGIKLSSKPKKYRMRIPIQKTGMAYATRKTTVEPVSTIESRRDAAKTPKNIPMIIETIRDDPIRMNVFLNLKSNRVFQTGSPK